LELDHGQSLRVCQRCTRRTPEGRGRVTAAEVAELLHMPTSTVEHLARLGKVPSRKVGRRRLFLRPRIEALLLDEA